ncbi:MAG: hypothetical protein P8X97_04395 [Candidatus Bathyarchaeota archaeon]
MSWITMFRRFRKDRRGVSNIIVVALSLVIILAIVTDIVLWNYEMNQVDYEKMKENIILSNVEKITQSPWFSVQSEYSINFGSRLDGDFLNTQYIDTRYESFTENASGSVSETNSFEMVGSFKIDLSKYQPDYLKTVEILLHYRSEDSSENWNLEAYDWFSSTFSNIGFNSTEGHTPTMGWDYYSINLTDIWQNYVNSNGTINVKLFDEGPDSQQTSIDIDFFGIRVKTDATQFTFKNNGSFTVHLVSLWIINATEHQHYDMTVFVNSADTEIYLRNDILLPTGIYSVKVVTERGNIAVYSRT